MPENDLMMDVQNLKKYFPIWGGILRRVIGWVKAVDGVSFEIKKGETFGLVGESGCGKSTVGRTILRLLTKTEGDVNYKGRDLFSLDRSELTNLRQEMQIIFQDPYSSLNPRLTVSDIVGEALKEHRITNGKETVARVRDTVEKCGLQPHHLRRYPHEFSGGQRQRIGLARALVLNPEFIVCDEPVSALDVSIQSQILNLLLDLQQDMGLTYLFISHDLSVVRHISNRVGVMYLGDLVEVSEVEKLFNNPQHPYTRALLSAIPTPNPRRKGEKILLKGSIPSPANPPEGCKFHTRCPEAKEVCKEKTPELVEIEEDHRVSCHLVDHD